MTSKIDFERAAVLMDVVARVANVSPAYMALSGAAMNELKEMNDVALEEQKVLGERRLKEEQAAAARLNEHNRKAAEKQAQIDREVADRTAASNATPPITVMPGEPVPDVVKAEVAEPETDVPQFPDDTTPVARRV